MMKFTRKSFILLLFSFLFQFNQNNYASESHIPTKDSLPFLTAQEKSLMDKWDNQGGKYLHPKCNPTIAQFSKKPSILVDDVFCIKNNGDVIWHRKLYSYSEPDIDNLGKLNKPNFIKNIKVTTQIMIEDDALVIYRCPANNSGECISKPGKEVLAYKIGIKSPKELQIESIKVANNGIKKLNASDNQGAIADFTKAIELNPQDSRWYLYRGQARARVYIKDKSYGIQYLEDAYSDFSKVIELNNGDTKKQGHLMRGVLNFDHQIGDKKTACNDLQWVYRQTYGDRDVPSAVLRHYGIKEAKTNNGWQSEDTIDHCSKLD